MHPDEDQNKKGPFDFDITAESQVDSVLVHESFLLETETGKNARYEDRSSRNLLTKYRDEVKEIWNIAVEEVEENIIENGDIGPSLGIFCRYPLILASVTEWGGNFSPDLVIALVDADLKPYDWGKAAEHLFDDASQQLWIASTLAARKLQEPEKTKEFNRILSRLGRVDVNDEERLIWLIEEVAPIFPKKLLPELVTAIENWHEDKTETVEDWKGGRPRALAALLPSLTESEAALRKRVLQTCLKLARAIPNSQGHAITLSMVLPFLSKKERDVVLRECIDCITRSALGSRPNYGMWSTGNIFPRLAEYTNYRFFEILLGLEEDEYSRNYVGGRIYRDICRCLAKAGRPATRVRYLMLHIYLFSIKDEEIQTTALVDMLPYVPLEWLAWMITPPETFKRLTWQQVLQAIFIGLLRKVTRAAPMSEQEQAQVYSHIKERILKQSSDRLSNLIKLLPYLPASSQEETKQDILPLIRQEERPARITYLVELSKQVSSKQRQELLQVALSLVHTDDTATLFALDIICSTLLDSTTFRQDDLEELLHLYPREGKYCLFGVTGLAPAHFLSNVWEIIQHFDAHNPYLLAKYIIRLTELGKTEQAYHQIYTCLRDLEGNNLAAFLGFLPPAILNGEIFEQVVEKLTSTQDENDIYGTLAVLDLDCIIDHLSESQVNRLMSWIQTSSSTWSSEVMSRVLPCYARLGYIEEAYKQTLELDKFSAKARSLIKIAHFVNEPARSIYIEEALIYIEKAKDKEYFSEAIRTFIEAFGRTAGDAKESVVDTDPDARTLVLLAQVLPKPESKERWEELPLDGYDRAKDLIPFVPVLPLFVIENALKILAGEACSDSDIHPRIEDSAWIESLLKRLRELDKAEHFARLKSYLSRAASMGRQKLLFDLCVLTPFLAELGSKETIVQIQDAAQCVCRWWN